MKKYLWMKVTKDKYQLPIAVGESARELSEMCDVDISTIFKAISRNEDKENNRCGWVKVEI